MDFENILLNGLAVFMVLLFICTFIFMLYDSHNISIMAKQCENHGASYNFQKRVCAIDQGLDSTTGYHKYTYFEVPGEEQQ